MPFKRSFLKVKQCDRSRRQYSNILSAFTAGALNQGKMVPWTEALVLQAEVLVP